MKIFKIGNGFVSEHLQYPKIVERLDFSSKQIEHIIDMYKPDVLVNCIGKTGSPNIDWCEVNREITALTNTTLPILLADVCQKKSIQLIHISSGCVFYGDSPNIQYAIPQFIINAPPVKIDLGWKETDATYPQSFYSKTKYAADIILEGFKNTTVLRIRMPLSEISSERNLINKLKKYDKLIDIPNSVTFMTDLVKCIDWAAKNSQTGIFHCTNPGTLTAVQVMQEYQKHVSNYKFTVINENELDNLTIAKRSNCILNTDKLKNAGFNMTLASEALASCMGKYIKLENYVK